MALPGNYVSGINIAHFYSLIKRTVTLNTSRMFLLSLLLCSVSAVDILLDGGFEGNQWEIVPSWALCNVHSCSVPAALQPGGRSGTHFLMVYPGRRVTIGQKFNETNYGSCQLNFYLKTTSKIDTLTTIYWEAEIYELSSYESQSSFGEWDFYSIPLSGNPDYLEIQFTSGNIAYAIADDFSLVCSPTNWSWSWTVDMIMLAVVGGCIILAGYKLVQQRQLISLLAEKYNLHWPEWLKRKPPPQKEAEMAVLGSAFNDDSE